MSKDSLLYFDIETMLEDEKFSKTPFSREAKKAHSIFSFQFLSSSGQKADLELVDKSLYLSNIEKKAIGEAEKTLLGKLQQRFFSHTKAMVGWNSLSFDAEVVAQRLKKAGLKQESFRRIKQVDLMLEAQKVFSVDQDLSAARAFDLKSFSRDFMDILPEDRRKSIIRRYGPDILQGKAHKPLYKDPTTGKVRELKGSELWKALEKGQDEAYNYLTKYALTDVDVLKIIDDETNLSKHALDPNIPIRKDLFRKMRRYDAAEAAEKFWGREIAEAEKVRLTLLKQGFKAKHLSPFGARIQLTGDDSMGDSPLSKWMKDEKWKSKLGFERGDVAWLIHDEAVSKHLGYVNEAGQGLAVAGVQIRHKGHDYRYNFWDEKGRKHYHEFLKKLATDIGDDETLNELEHRGRKLASNKDTDSLQNVATRLSKKVKELNPELPSGLEDYIKSPSQKGVGALSSMGALRKAAPYALGLLAGADVLASREKSAPMLGLAGAGIGAFITKGSPGLARLAGIAGGYVIGRAIGSSIAKQHEGPIEGFQEYGKAATLRKMLTDFGSGWDPLAKIIREARLGRGVKEVMDSPFIQNRIKAAMASGPVKKLGEGGYGAAELYKMKIGDKEVSFVKKTYFETGDEAVKVMNNEKRVLDVLSDDITPTVYGSGISEGGNPYMIMEYMEGKSAVKHASEGLPFSARHKASLDSALKRLHSTGEAFGDVRLENMVVVDNDRIALIDPCPNRFDSAADVLGPNARLALGQALDKRANALFRKLPSEQLQDEINMSTGALAYGFVPEENMDFSEISRRDWSRAKSITKMHLQEAGIPNWHPSQGYIERPELLPQTSAALELTQSGQSAQTVKTFYRSAAQLKQEIRGNEAAENMINSTILNKHPNELEGFSQDGIAAQRRKIHSDFGSGRDPVRGLARMFGIVTENSNIALKEVLEHPEFKAALLNPNNKKLGEVGAGGVGSVSNYEMSINGKKVKYAMKVSHQPTTEFSKEYEGLRAMQDEAGPTPYMRTFVAGPTGQMHEALYMEYLEDCVTLKEFQEAGLRLNGKQTIAIEKSMAALNKEGYFHSDLTPRNVLINKSGEAFVIDPMPHRYSNIPEFNQLGFNQDALAVREIIKGEVRHSDLQQLSNGPTYIATNKAKVFSPEGDSLLEELYTRLGKKKHYQEYRRGALEIEAKKLQEMNHQVLQGNVANQKVREARDGARRAGASLQPAKAVDIVSESAATGLASQVDVSAVTSVAGAGASRKSINAAKRSMLHKSVVSKMKSQLATGNDLPSRRHRNMNQGLGFGETTVANPPTSVAVPGAEMTQLDATNPLVRRFRY